MSSNQSILQKRLFSLNIGPFTFSPGWITTLFTACFLVLLFKLGIWQTHRGQFKSELIERYQQRSQSGEVSFEALLTLDKNSMDYPVTLTGAYLHSKSFLLDNRTYRGIPGFQVVTPLDMGDRYVLINRGWVAQGKTRQDMPEFPMPTEDVQISGVTHIPNPDFFVLEEDNYNEVRWPFIIQKIDISKSTPLFDKPLAPFVIRLNPDESSGFIREWHNNPMTPEKHYGYAFQWFSLTLALAVIYVTVNTHRRNDTDNNSTIIKKTEEQ